MSNKLYTSINPLYVKHQVTYEVALLPKYINENIKANLFEVFAQQYEGICYERIYIYALDRIISYNQGVIMHDDNICQSRHLVTMLCSVVMPAIDKAYLLKVNNIIVDGDASFINLRNGPLNVLVPSSNMSKAFKIVNKKILVNNKELTVDDYLIVIIKELDMVTNSKNIIAIGYAEDIYDITQIKDISEYYK